MEGSRAIAQSTDVLRRIRELTKSILTDLSKGSSPTISIDRFRNYCTDSIEKCCCSLEFPCGKEIVTLQRECHARRLDVLLRVLLIVQRLLQEKRHGSKRDIYYMHPSAFSDGIDNTTRESIEMISEMTDIICSQVVVDRAINDLCIILRCSRHNLNVVSVGNGLVMGWLIFTEAENKFDCIASLNTGHPIPVYVEEVKDVTSAAQYILVVEKESVFQRLADDHFCRKNRCIVITGRGYPDVPTRRFLRLLIEKLQLPVYCLVDCDPYGFDILSTYRFGSMLDLYKQRKIGSNVHSAISSLQQMAYDAKLLRVQGICWLGALPSDTEKYNISKECLLPLTAEDKKRTEAMLQRCYLQREAPQWRLELEIMLHRGVKFEIEALSVHSISFLSKEYIPSKIRGEMYI